MRIHHATLLALVATFLVTPGVAWVAGVKGGGEEFENRTLAKRPALTARAVFNGSYGSQFSDWVWDTIPLRDVALRMDSFVDFALLHDSPRPSVVVLGKDDFFFARDRMVGHKSGAVDVKRLLAALDHIEKAYADAGVKLVIAVSPTKEMEYVDEMPDAYAAEHRRTVTPVVDALRARSKTDPALLDLWSALDVEKERVANESDPRLRTIFRKHDLHWNVETGRVQARAILDRIDPNLWRDDVAPVISSETVDLESELSRVHTKTGNQEPYRKETPSPRVKLETSYVAGVNPYKCTSVVDDYTPSPLRIAVVRDSFLSSSVDTPGPAHDGEMETIASLFGEVTFVHWDTLANQTKAADEKLRGHDVLVLQIVAGNLFTLLAQETKLVDLAHHWR